MPNRILRDWTFSEKVDTLSFEGEVFFTRLLMKADDYGLFYGNPRILRSSLFPLRDSIDLDKINGWLLECVNSGLIRTYTNNDKVYIEIVEFGQRLRIMKSKFPHPPEKQKVTINTSKTAVNGLANDSKLPPETETEEKHESESETKVNIEFDFFWIEYDKKVGNKEKLKKKWDKLSDIDREKAIQYLSGYKKSQPDKKYRKNPETFLNNKSWEDELIITKVNSNGKQSPKTNSTTIIPTGKKWDD